MTNLVFAVIKRKLNGKFATYFPKSRERGEGQRQLGESLIIHPFWGLFGSFLVHGGFPDIGDDEGDGVGGGDVNDEH